ncbi:uncharacterized protein LOC130670131 isoform X2 [Microplitis mediator]|uniref:uncharacterized protein LOC130670131 isoform X2 n=1 Tax=Microplitis mediator TaxID=375433 RepID=UPI002556B8D0|nr:uncharacterized protein LOC130670131 isoform X2 [Microplitis mediator]
MKPQKKGIVSQKAPKSPPVAKKRKVLDKLSLDNKTDKKSKKLLSSSSSSPSSSSSASSSDKTKKGDSDKKKDKATEKRKKIDPKTKVDVKLIDDKKKCNPKEMDVKKIETDDKKMDKDDDCSLDLSLNSTSGNCGTEKKKNNKSDDKIKTEKVFDGKKKSCEIDKKKILSKDSTESGENDLSLTSLPVTVTDEVKNADDKSSAQNLVGKKNSKVKDDKNKKDCKLVNSKDSKENGKNQLTKDKKVDSSKKIDKDVGKKSKAVAVKKEINSKNINSGSKKSAGKKTCLLGKKSVEGTKKLADKKLKLVNKSKDKDDSSSVEDEEELLVNSKTKKKNPTNAKSKVSNNSNNSSDTNNQDSNNKKPKLAKQMKAKLPAKNGKLNNAVLKREKLKKITDKIVNRRKMELKESADKVNMVVDGKKMMKEEPLNSEEDDESIKKEICNDKEDEEESCCSGAASGGNSNSGSSNGSGSCLQVKSSDVKKSLKTPSKSKTSNKKQATKKSVKSNKSLEENCEKVCLKTGGSSPASSPCASASDDSSSSDSTTVTKQSTKNEETAGSGVKATSKKENECAFKIDLKVEKSNDDSNESQEASSSCGDSDEDYENELETRRNRQKKKKDREDSTDEERARRMRLFGFWSGPKRHRVASLNALAKVHCMYENEAGGVYLGGFCKPKPEKDKVAKKSSSATATATAPAAKEDKEESGRKEKDNSNKKTTTVTSKTESENVAKRNLRNVPGLRGKHWDMMECSSSSSSSSEDESNNEQPPQQSQSQQPRNPEVKNAKRGRKKNSTVRRKKPEEVMDLKDMVVCKRMASLNASAILAASYSDEKHLQSSSSTESSSSESSEVEFIKRRKQHGDAGETAAERRKAKQEEEALKASKKVVIVNQDTDVTITGVYVNQTRSTHHEGFCSIAGMQYRISSTSHTQTAATAVAAELHEQKPEQPCKSYTPLGALSSMQPPGSQATHPNMSPRRHSAFSAPHQHGYYQPAGPLIQHPPTLPPIKGPPPEPTPTPPQNSESSDDLVATSTTSGGTNSTGNSWRSYRKTDSRLPSSAIPSTSIVPSGGFYRAYCPQYYGTPPQYQELCYPPTYPHPHPHPPPYYKYAPAYRRQYYSYPEAGGGGGAGGAGTGAPGVVEYQPPPPPSDYSMPPYYAGYPPPPAPPPPPPNPAYLHAQGRPIVDHAAFQGCPCPMQSCPKNVDTGPLIGNGKGAPVASGPGLSLPPSALVGPPSPARGLAGLAPPHGANAWDTDRVQINTHNRNINNNNQNQQLPSSTTHINECRTKEEQKCTDNKCNKCTCQKRACTSTCDVKIETLSPAEATVPSPSLQSQSPVSLQQSQPTHPPTLQKLPPMSTESIRTFKMENNNVKCESCSVGIVSDNNLSCVSNCNVKCEEQQDDYKCGIIKCEQCLKEEREMAILEIDKDSGILMIDDKLEAAEAEVKEELNDVVVVNINIDNQNWTKPDYEDTVTETIEDKVEKINGADVNDVNVNVNKTDGINTVDVNVNKCSGNKETLPKCQKLTKRKLSLDSLSSPKKIKLDKRTLSVGSTRDSNDHRVPNPMNGEFLVNRTIVADRSSDKGVDKLDCGSVASVGGKEGKKKVKKESCKRKADDGVAAEGNNKRSKKYLSNGITNCHVKTASAMSIMETINNVIQQSVQMTSKNDEDINKCNSSGNNNNNNHNNNNINISNNNNNNNVSTKSCNAFKERDSKRKSVNLLSTIKNVPKTIVKTVVTDKLCVNKADCKLIKDKDKELGVLVGGTGGVDKDKCKESKSRVKGNINSNKIVQVKNKVDGRKPGESKLKGKVVKICEERGGGEGEGGKKQPAALVKKKNNKKSTKKICGVGHKKASGRDESVTGVVSDSFSCLTKKGFLKPKWSNGWSWEGDSYEAKVYLTNEESAIRRCYKSMKHISGDVLRPRDCVLLKSGPRKADLPFVAKIAALWENPDDGEMMFSLLWYYRPEHTEQGRTDFDTEDEVFASRHRDANSVACIEDKCYILTFNEYCRYRKNLRRIEENLECPGLIVPPGEQSYPRESRQPPIPVPADMVLFCRRVYDYRGKKLVKNPG